MNDTIVSFEKLTKAEYTVSVALFSVNITFELLDSFHILLHQVLQNFHKLYCHTISTNLSV